MEPGEPGDDHPSPESDEAAAARQLSTPPDVRRRRAFWRSLPSAPRCKLCTAPFGGPGGSSTPRLSFTTTTRRRTAEVSGCPVVIVRFAHLHVAHFSALRPHASRAVLPHPAAAGIRSTGRNPYRPTRAQQIHLRPSYRRA